MRITDIKVLDQAMGEEPVSVQVTNVHGTRCGILTGVRNDGRFDVYDPGHDEELVFHLSDCIVVTY